MKRMKINGESGDVRGKTVDSWKERVPELHRDIRVRKSGTSMELLVFGGLYLIMALAREDYSAKVVKGKTAGDNCLNCKWRNEATVVIWKSENSRE